MIEPTSLAQQSGALSVESQLQTALVQTQDWLTLVDGDPPANDFRAPSGLGSIGIDGPGWLAFNDHGRRVFARQAALSVRPDGYIVDDRGALLLGYTGALGGDPAPMRIPGPGKALGDVEIDGNGRIVIALRPSNAARYSTPVIIGRIAIAFPESPQNVLGRAQRISQQELGVRPRYLPAGEVHLGVIQHNPPVIRSEEVRDNIRRLWDASGRGELEVALAASVDAVERIALNLVR
jgi:hypothetical protein